MKKQLKGKTAFKSDKIIKGKARIVSNKEDIEKVQEGDIIITDITNAEFIGQLKNSGALKKCSALVTEEGGILSHASIAARDLKIPCIVGVKNASKLIKDNQEVKVDTNKGLIKFL